MLELRKGIEKLLTKKVVIINALNSYRLLIITGILIILEKAIISSFDMPNKFIMDCLLTLLIVIPPLFVTIKGKTRQDKDQEKAMYLALHDSLTGLPNRMKLQEELKEIIRYNKKFNIGVMFLDLDSFKAVNDTFGHEVGDKLLQAVAKRLQNCIREKDMVCRLGGDEFVLVFPEVEEVQTVEAIAKKILQVFETAFSIDNQILRITASIGISICPADGKEVEKLVKNADKAMYKCKTYGKNRYEFYCEELEASYVEAASDLNNNI